MTPGESVIVAVKDLTQATRRGAEADIFEHPQGRLMMRAAKYLARKDGYGECLNTVTFGLNGHPTFSAGGTACIAVRSAWSGSAICRSGGGARPRGGIP